MALKSSLSDFLLQAQRMFTQGSKSVDCAAAWAVARHKAGAQHRQQHCHGWPDDLRLSILGRLYLPRMLQTRS
jgi:hypothetical protein